MNETAKLHSAPGAGNSTTIRTKAIVFFVLTIIPLLMLYSARMNTMGPIPAERLKGAQAAKAENALMLTVEKAHAHFKTQVQEWKNLLIRGNDPKRFDQYLGRFKEEVRIVQTELDTAIRRMGELGLDTVAAETLKRDHADLAASYDEALKQFNPADPNTGKVVDQLVKGIDRPASAGMQALVYQMETRYARLGGEPAYVAEIARTLGEGNLAITIEVGRDDRVSVLADMQGMMEKLQQIKQVASAVEQVAATSQAVAQGGSEQASAL